MKITLVGAFHQSGQHKLIREKCRPCCVGIARIAPEISRLDLSSVKRKHQSHALIILLPILLRMAPPRKAEPISGPLLLMR